MSNTDRHDALLRMLRVSWVSPPDAVHSGARRLPDFEPTPVLGSEHATERWKPEDVRGSELIAPETPVMSVHSFSYADVALRIVPPADQSLWRIEGRVWLHDATEVTPIRVVLSLGDHVLAELEVEDGSPFAFEDALGTGWRVEAHVPGRASLVVEDPRA